MILGGSFSGGLNRKLRESAERIAHHESAHRAALDALLTKHDAIVLRGTPPTAVESSALRALELRIEAAATARLDAARDALSACLAAQAAAETEPERESKKFFCENK